MHFSAPQLYIITDPVEQPTDYLIPSEVHPDIPIMIHELPIFYARNTPTTMSQYERNMKFDTKMNKHNTPNTAMATVSRASSGKTPRPR